MNVQTFHLSSEATTLARRGREREIEKASGFLYSLHLGERGRESKELVAGWGRQGAAHLILKKPYSSIFLSIASFFGPFFAFEQLLLPSSPLLLFPFLFLHVPLVSSFFSHFVSHQQSDACVSMCPLLWVYTCVGRPPQYFSPLPFPFSLSFFSFSIVHELGIANIMNG